MCEFELEDEEAAFAYAEERMRATTSRLAVTNRVLRVPARVHPCAAAHDVDGALDCFSEEFVYDDHRRLSGDPVVGLDAMRAAIERIFEQYTQFDFRVLAVRGQRLHLLWSRWSDDDGNETTTLYVNETDDDGRVVLSRPLRRGRLRRAPTANSSGATTPERARHSPKRVPRRPSGRSL